MNTQSAFALNETYTSTLNFTQFANYSDTITINESDFYSNISVSYNIKFHSGNYTPEIMNASEVNSHFQSMNLTEDYIYVLVQFNVSGGDPTQNQIQNMTDNNITLLGGIMDHTYKAKFPKDFLENNSYDFIRWCDILNSSDKIQQNINNFTVENPNEAFNITVIFFENISQNYFDEFANYSNYIIENSSLYDIVIINTNTSLINNISDLNYVKWVENYSLPQLQLDRSSAIITTDFVRIFGGVSSSDATVGLLDNGIEHNHPHFSSITIYDAHDWPGRDTYPEADSGFHGTFVAGVVSGSATVDGRFISGISDKASLVVERVFNDTRYDAPNPSLDIIWESLLDIDADGNFTEPNSPDVISISFGDPGSNGTYGSTARKLDEVVLGLLPNTPIEIPVVTSSGNTGHTNLPGTTEPGTAKNAITVGATSDFTNSDNSCLRAGVTANADPDHLYIVDRSSRGTADGRVKPDVLAPGYWLTGPSPTSTYGTAGGTSLAAPHVSSLVAQLIQVLRLDEELEIHPETIKSLIIGQTIGGSTTDNIVIDEGWGRVDAFRTIYQLSDEIIDFFSVFTVGEPGSGFFQEIIYEGDFTNVPADSDKLIVTLVYSDLPGDPIVTKQLINDLDLFLVNPSGSTLQYTVDDDDINNVEKYVINNPQSGEWEFHVKAIDIFGERGSQRYALKWQVIKETTSVSLTIDLDAAPAVVARGDTVEAFGRVESNGILFYDVKSDLDEPDGLSITSGELECTDQDKETMGNMPDTSGRSTRVFTMIADTTGTKNIEINVTGNKDTGGSFSDTDSFIVTVLAADGDSCSLDSECFSNYCDSDGVGLSDDGWCFTPFNTYFDGQETSYCEFSTDNGVADCDERQVGDDLNKCSGITYYEEECSSACSSQDVTTVFECTESGCSCTELLCDGLTTGSSINTCSANQTYFADQCSSTASGEDRTDNICRSSSFNSTCTGDEQCDGIEAGTGDCTSTCVYDPLLDVDKFFIQNSTGGIVAWFGDAGNIVLKGTLEQNSNHQRSSNDEWIIRNNNEDVLIIDTVTGNLYIDGYNQSEIQTVLTPDSASDFIIQNSTGSTVIYVNESGSIFMTGSITENGNP